MAPLQDPDDIKLAIESQAQGTIEEYAKNPGLLEKRRRESLNYPPPSDSPEPRYTTANIQALQSTGLSSAVLDREDDIYLRYASILRRDIALQDVLDCEEDGGSTVRCAYVGKPERRYNTEKSLEMTRIDSFKEKDEQCSNGTREWLAAMDRSRQEALTRHFIRRRWEAMGVWNNNSWKLKPSPDTRWEWPWLPPRRLWDSGILRLTKHALEKCGILRSGCFGELMRNKASNQTPQSFWGHVEADDFISSRPWFAFEIECMVEDTRREQLPAEAKGLLPTESSDFIRRQWMKKGIWNDEWSCQGRVQEGAFVGWRWENESPEPQQADMTELNAMYEMDFTESESEEMRRARPPARTSPATGPRRSARIAALQERKAAEAARAAQESVPIPRAPARRRRAPPRPAPTRVQPKRGGKGKRRANDTEDTADAAKKSKGRTTKRRRRG